MFDSVGSYIFQLPSGHCIVANSSWDNGDVEDVGAVTFLDRTKGTTGEVSAANSLTGSTGGDRIGEVTILANGNYVVTSPDWHNGDERVGAVTWCNGETGRVGSVSTANSLVGRIPNSRFNSGRFEVYGLSNGNYVVIVDDRGAQGSVTWLDGNAVTTGVIGPANSLVETGEFDSLGSGGVVPLPNGNYVVVSPGLDAATFGNGTATITGLVSESNSLIGSGRGNQTSVVVLENGDYVVVNPGWRDNGEIRVDGMGAVTWASGETGITGMVTRANSLAGDKVGDTVGSGGVTVLGTGNYVVNSPDWDNGETRDAGAATFVNGSGPIVATVSPLNSLVGSSPDDHVGYVTTPLPNGNYVVGSPDWDHGAIADAGAATFANGTNGITGAVSEANSLVGSSAGDRVGGMPSRFQAPIPIGLITTLDNGNFLLRNPFWDNGQVVDAGAVTLVDGTTGIVGEVSATNSLIGATAGDQIGFMRSGGNGVLFDTVRPLPGGGYVIASPAWDNGGIVDTGAITIGDGSSALPSMISADNSTLGNMERQFLGREFYVDESKGVVFVRDLANNALTLVTAPVDLCTAQVPDGLEIDYDGGTNEVTIRWQAGVGRSYAIDGSDGLRNFAVPIVEGFTAPAADAVFTFPRPAGADMWYRVRELCQTMP